MARALKILVANPFSVVALLFHQGYLTSGESWLGYQSMVQAHGMRGYLGIDPVVGQTDFEARLKTASANG